ncbi:hypothetical protein UFOVP328_395 [uncultured Caudovirales phage]|uniref:Uncharacterized protein n=1 Tax=uncultured Caudovirales phage TaxID=2100421 RepID=A0A6J5LWJ0_9CAUD|nr:hypothetical protein UFOVP328_395 [uncultured Caudovirales phage]
MSVPLDRLYHMLDDVSGDDILIYRFAPHGSKKIEDISPLKKYLEQLSWLKVMTQPSIIFHDQEPLFYDFYSSETIWYNYQNKDTPVARCRIPEYQQMIKNMHIRSQILYPLNWYDKILLGHSEKNSKNLDLYEQNGFIGVYWWSHAVIARDWFRYAEYDQQLAPNFDNISQDFLIYNRAWSGTREYRLTFADLLVDQQVVAHCKTSFAQWDSGVKYTDHQYANPKLQIQRDDLEQYFESNNTKATASADYVAEDYQQCAIEVVLETLFDDTRLHLTEKILRPIACGRPFMLAGTPGSLRYLRSYGFTTFGQYIDESYDDIVDPQERLKKIVAEMKRIAQLDSQSKLRLWQNLYSIAEQNKQMFFSNHWYDSIIREYQSNLTQALSQLENHRTGRYWKTMMDITQQYPEVKQELAEITTRKNIAGDINQLNYLLGILQ